jgi:hypothetical protein
MHRLFALLSVTFIFTSITTACAASPENEVSRETSPSPSAPFSMGIKIGEEIDAGMKVEDLIQLQCSCNSTVDDSLSDLVSDKLATAYTRYAVTKRNVQEYLNDYLDLCDMRIDVRVNPLYDTGVANTHHDQIVYAIRKARRDITTLIEKEISYRQLLVKMTSEAAVEALDDKHGWNTLDDKQALEGKSKRPRHPEPSEPIFKDIRTAPSLYDGLLYH